MTPVRESFPILGERSSVPWAFVEQGRRWAEINHHCLAADNTGGAFTRARQSQTAVALAEAILKLIEP